jgi:hypothetical protein
MAKVFMRKLPLKLAVIVLIPCLLTDSIRAVPLSPKPIINPIEFHIATCALSSRAEAFPKIRFGVKPGEDRLTFISQLNIHRFSRIFPGSNPEGFRQAHKSLRDLLERPSLLIPLGIMMGIGTVSSQDLKPIEPAEQLMSVLWPVVGLIAILVVSGIAYLWNVRNARPTAVDAYKNFYDGIRESVSKLVEIRKDDLERSRTFLNASGELKSRDERRANGTFGVTEVYFLRFSETQRRMARFQHALKARFGNKLYLVHEDASDIVKAQHPNEVLLHFTTQGLELQWDDKATGTKKEYVMHRDKEVIDPDREPFAGVRARARSIQTKAVKMQVARVNWNPAIGIFWELQPYVSDPASDPVMQRRTAWDLPQPRPPHVTAAYFAQPFSPEELAELREMVATYQQPGYFGDIDVTEVQVIAYEDLAFNAGYRVLETISFVTDESNNSTSGKRRVSSLLSTLWHFVLNTVLRNRRKILHSRPAATASVFLKAA